MGKVYLVKDANKIRPIPCPCGSSIRLITRNDTPIANLILLILRILVSIIIKTVPNFTTPWRGRGKWNLERRRLI